MTEARWRRRYRAPRVLLPSWARDDPERLVYASNASGKWEVYAWDRRAGTHRQVTDRPEGTIGHTIHPLGREVWWFDDTKGNELGRWIIEPFDPPRSDLRSSGDPGLGGTRRVAAPSLPPAYSAGVAIARDFAVVGSSREGGVHMHVVHDGEVARELYAHRQHAWVAGLSRDESLLCITHSEHGDHIHPALRVLDLEGRAIAELWDGPGLGLHLAGWSRVPGDQRALVVHERRDQPRPEVWDVATGRVRELDIDLPGEIAAYWYPDASALLLLHEHRGRSELYRLDLDTEALERIPTPTGVIQSAAIRPDGEVWYHWSSSSTPPEVRSGSEIVIRPPGEVAPSGIAYSDAVVAGVHFFLAEPPTPRPHPTVFQVHGGPTAQDADYYNATVQAWVDHGYAVALVNYRGSTGYGRAWRDALIGSPGFTELEDIATVHDFVVREGIADPRRVVIAGGSWGGYLTLLGLGCQPQRWALGVAGVPVADYLAAYEDEMEPLKRYDDSLFGGSPQDKPALYRERSPLTYSERVRAPVLVLAGENDPRCPIRQIDNYLRHLRKLGKPHEVYRYDAGHGSLVIEETVKQMELRLDFVARHLGTTPPLREE